MSARLSTFVYPWDLARLGVERTLEQIAADGFDGVYLASTYHPIDALSPRDGRLRLFASGRGAVHFPARPERYGHIRPSTSSPDVRAAWPEAAAIAGPLGLELVPWTIVLYQPWIVDQHPDCARVLPSGDPIDAGVCPANDHVREYVVALCDDIVDQFGVGTLHLEGVTAPSYDYGWLRARLLVDLPEIAHELLALCFCPSCRRRGTDAGLDVERVQRQVNDAIAAGIDTGPTDAPPVAPADGGDAELQAFAELYVRASFELVDAVAERLRGYGTRLSGLPWLPVPTLLVQDEGLYDEMLRPFDQVLVRPSADDRRTQVAMAARDARGLELGVMLLPDRLRPGGAAPPAGVTRSGRIAEDLRGAAEIGAAEIAVYNYGLLRDADVRQLVHQAQSDHDRGEQA